jgi:DNA repair exonuclease SbcCD ATPase subunit
MRPRILEIEGLQSFEPGSELIRCLSDNGLFGIFGPTAAAIHHSGCHYLASTAG